jgi:hypothetical protein
LNKSWALGGAFMPEIKVEHSLTECSELLENLPTSFALTNHYWKLKNICFGHGWHCNLPKTRLIHPD